MNVLKSFEQLVIAGRQETDVTPLMEPFYRLDRALTNLAEDNAEANSGVVRGTLAAFLVTPPEQNPSAILPLSDGQSRLGFKWLSPPTNGLNFWLIEGSQPKAENRLNALLANRNSN